MEEKTQLTPLMLLKKTLQVRKTSLRRDWGYKVVLLWEVATQNSTLGFLVNFFVLK